MNTPRREPGQKKGSSLSECDSRSLTECDSRRIRVMKGGGCENLEVMLVEFPGSYFKFFEYAS